MWHRNSDPPLTGAPPIMRGIGGASEPESGSRKSSGWVKTVDGGCALRYCGVGRNRFWMKMTTASYNLVRLTKLTQAGA